MSEGLRLRVVRAPRHANASRLLEEIHGTEQPGPATEPVQRNRKPQRPTRRSWHPSGLVEGTRRALRSAIEPNRSTLKQGCGGCRVRSETESRTEQNRTHTADSTRMPHTRAAQDQALDTRRPRATAAHPHTFAFTPARGVPLQADQLCLLMIDAPRARTTYYSTNPNLCAFVRTQATGEITRSRSRPRVGCSSLPCRAERRAAVPHQR